eukprot:s2438_g4.t1
MKSDVKKPRANSKKNASHDRGRKRQMSPSKDDHGDHGGDGDFDDPTGAISDVVVPENRMDSEIHSVDPPSDADADARMVPTEGDQGVSSSHEPESADQVQRESREEAPLQQEASSSSSNAMPVHANPEQPLHDHGDCRVAGPRVYQTPVEITGRVVPSEHCRLHMDQNAHRFTVVCHYKGFDFPEPYQNKTFNRNFGVGKTWQVALKECHDYMWNKWELIKDRSPCTLDEFQTPGRVPDAVMDDMAAFIRNRLPLKKSYGS